MWTARRWIAFSLIGLLLVVVAGACVLIWIAIAHSDAIQLADFIEKLKGLVEPVFGGLIGITGTATGFYFGSKKE